MFLANMELKLKAVKKTNEELATLEAPEFLDVVPRLVQKRFQYEFRQLKQEIEQSERFITANYVAVYNFNRRVEFTNFEYDQRNLLDCLGQLSAEQWASFQWIHRNGPNWTATNLLLKEMPFQESQLIKKFLNRASDDFRLEILQKIGSKSTKRRVLIKYECMLETYERHLDYKEEFEGEFQPPALNSTFLLP